MRPALRSHHRWLAAPLLALCAVAIAQRSPAPAPAAQDGAWTILFDGTSAEHFRGFRKDAMPSKGWVVRDGALCCEAGGGGGDIVTREEYADFELAFEWRVAPGGNSGVIYRCDEKHDASWQTGLEFQILDDAAHRDGLKPQTGAGSIYDLAAPSKPMARPPGEWNEARIVARGTRIEHWLNGEKIVDVDLASDECRKAKAASKWASMPDFGTLAKGRIALQDHGDEVCYRNIRVRALR